MTKDFNYKPYLICAVAISALSCIFSYKNAIGFLLGTLYFFISDRLNHHKFSNTNLKSLAVGKVFLILIIQFIIMAGLAILCFYIGGIPTLIFSFTGMIIPHIYFIIVELRKIKK